MSWLLIIRSISHQTIAAIAIFLACFLQGIYAQEIGQKAISQAINSPEVIKSEPLSQMVWSDIDGNPLEWTDRDQIRVLCFLGVECPVARFYATRIDELDKRYAGTKIRFVGINSNLHDSIADLHSFTQELGLSFPQVKDRDQAIARAFGATRTAEVVVMDQHHHVLYRGRIDDQYSPGVKRSGSTRNELENAITSLLDGKSPGTARTEPVGCLITFDNKVAESSAESGSVSFCKHVAPILFEHCYECHRPKEIGPFDVSNYEEVRGWADMVVEVIEQKRMPPWHANETEHAFKNARHMPAESLDIIKRWVKHGAPYGDSAELPKLPPTMNGWRLPKPPDLILSMRDRPYTIAASGAIDYQYFVVDPKLTEDRWISAAQVIPGNASVVHHAIVFIRLPDGVDSHGVGWITAFVPGQRATMFPRGYARRVPAGSKFVFQMHYTPNGVEQKDISKIGVNFIEADQVTHEVFTLVGLDQEFEIPPHASDHQVATSVSTWPRNSELLAIMPHMHLRGKSFRLAAVPKTETAQDATDSTILDVPRYDFNWQHTYELESPIPLNSMQRLNVTVSFDNSSDNPFNPNPNEYVLWGDQTWEEMAVAFLEVAKPLSNELESANPTSSVKSKIAAASDIALQTNDPKAVAFAEKLLKKYDRNRDSQLSRDEAPQIIRDYSFDRFDGNHNGIVTKDEIIAASRNSRD